MNSASNLIIRSMMSFLFNPAKLFLVFSVGVILISSVIVSCGSPTSVQRTVADSIIVQGKELIPEGIAIHPTTGVIYLSSLHQNKIVSVDKEGNIKDLISSGQNGFMRGIGIKISKDGQSLWACSASLDTVKSVSGLFQIELSSGKVLNTYIYNSDSTSLFNDLAIHSNGDIYLTDTFQGTVFKFQPSSGKVEPWLHSDQFTYANGIALSGDEKILFVASGNKGIQRIDLQSKEITSVTKGTRTDYAIDGLLYHNNSLIGVTGWPQEQVHSHRVIRYQLDNNHYLKTVDTILINKPYLNVPTTAAIYHNRLFVLAKTNLGLFNKGGQSIESVRDSLEFPVIVERAID